jgi:hypothetical protein
VRRAYAFAGPTFLAAVLGCSVPILAQAPATVQAQAPKDNDHTLQAMHDEMARSKSRLELKIPGMDRPQDPYYIEYRLLDLDVREVVAEFGALVSSSHARNRFMDVQARVGDYKLDSSNFISDDGFRGFIGPTGSVGIDRGRNLFAQAGVLEQPRPPIRHRRFCESRAPTTY